MRASVFQLSTVTEIEIPFEVAAARYTVRVHVEGTCLVCPSDDPERCQAFRCAIRRLIHHGGLGAVYRAI
ncbi:hypothetical protein O7635_27875 [Asanoa sp. WMMD1127]|uniref:hypothetical protein n=1 Tax=Asanoa sp. WMMD1127 TaxID=3016107 RepID=UPI0024171DA0|nr:hypothetical protein [Asanoa sp. WMMD1127]MDG4825682.1 hypothetical protein [Asanoa sp. WMMD1127]